MRVAMYCSIVFIKAGKKFSGNIFYLTRACCHSIGGKLSYIKGHNYFPGVLISHNCGNQLKYPILKTEWILIGLSLYYSVLVALLFEFQTGYYTLYTPQSWAGGARLSHTLHCRVGQGGARLSHTLHTPQWGRAVRAYHTLYTPQSWAGRCALITHFTHPTVGQVGGRYCDILT